jgi:putative DNA primase/helicase
MTTRTFYERASAEAQHGNGLGPDGTASAVNDVPGREAVIVPASTITPEDVEWIWPGRLAVGTLTNCVGLPDQGKSLLFTDLASRITTGAPMPPAPRVGGAGAAGRVLILTAEDALNYAVVPRLIKAGADLTLVDFVRMVKDAEGHTSLVTLETDLDVLARALQAKPYRLMVVDGIAGYLGTAKTHNDADVRRVLTPFVALLEQTRVAGFSVMHPPKAVTNLAYFAGGSIAFTSVPRVTLGIAKDPNDESDPPRRLLAKLKGNLYGHVPALSYQIKAESDAGVPWLEWAADPVAVDVRDVFDPAKETPEERSTVRDCVEWLRAHLAHFDKPAKDVEQAALAASFKLRTLERAKSKAGIISKKDGAGPWVWTLPPPAEGRPR